MLINQVSRSANAQEKLTRILAFILSEFKIFQVMQFSLEPSTFTAHPVKPDVGDGDNSARTINGSLNSFVYAPTPGSGTQRAYGFESEIDRMYINDLEAGTVTPEGLRRQIENEQIRLGKKVAGDVLLDMFGGSGTAPKLYGLSNLIKDVADESGQSAYLGLTQAQVHESLVQVAMQLDLTSKATLRAFEEALTRELSEMSGDPVLVMNNWMFARMTSVAKELGLYSVTTSDFGKPVDMFGNYRMVPVPLKYLPQTESDGQNQDNSSIYAIEYNEADGVRYATNSGFYFVDFENLETKPTGKSRLEFYGNIKVEDMKKIKRFSRIRL